MERVYTVNLYWYNCLLKERKEIRGTPFCEHTRYEIMAKDKEIAIAQAAIQLYKQERESFPQVYQVDVEAFRY